MNNTIALTLQPATTLSEEQLNAAEQARLLSETKKIICAACRVQNARDIAQLIATTATAEQCHAYAKQTDGGDFAADKATIATNLKLLCAAKVLSCDDDIIKIISKDIKDQHRLRARRRMELEKLQTTQSRLVTKGTYYEDQATYYERYIADCLAKQTAVKEGKTRKKRYGASFRSKSTSNNIKYSAEELKKKGVLIGITEESEKDAFNYKRLQVTFF